MVSHLASFSLTYYNGLLPRNVVLNCFWISILPIQVLITICMIIHHQWSKNKLLFVRQLIEYLIINSIFGQNNVIFF